MISWIFGIVFIVIGVFECVFGAPRSGSFLPSSFFAYFPPANTILKKRFGFSIPLAAKIIVGFVILWGTLAVGDLAEMFGL